MVIVIVHILQRQYEDKPLRKGLRSATYPFSFPFLLKLRTTSVLSVSADGATANVFDFDCLLDPSSGHHHSFRDTGSISAPDHAAASLKIATAQT